MGHEIVCGCGEVLPVPENVAGSSIICSCGRTVPVPFLGELRGDGITAGLPPTVPDRWPDEPPPEPAPPEEILAPTQVLLWTDGAAVPGRPVPVMVALTPDALWIQDTWKLRQISLKSVGTVEAGRASTKLTLSLQTETSAERLNLTFASAAAGRRWYQELQARQPGHDGAASQSGRRRRWYQEQLTRRKHAAPGERHVPDGVALVARAPDVPHVVLGQVTCSGRTRWRAERGLQLRAGMRGADAVIAVERQRCTEEGWRGRRVTGLAIRVDAADRHQLRRTWYAEEVGALVNRMLLLLVVQTAALFLTAVFGVGASPLAIATGETRSEALVSAGLGLGLLFAGPLVLLALLRVLRWRELIPIAGLGVLAATTGRVLTVWLAHVLAARAAGAAVADSPILVLMDPFEWGFIIGGALVSVRAWNLARDAYQILPPEVQLVSRARKAWSHGLLAATGAYVIVFLGLVGAARYENSVHLLQPGADPRREHQAMLAFNEGLARANQGDLDAAEQSWQRALGLWEELTARPPTPVLYRANLAMTLNNLGWIRHQRGHIDEAEKFYVRAVAIADELADDPQLGDEFKKIMADTRQRMAELRGDKLSKALEEKDQTAVRKYEDAQVQSEKGAIAAAESLYQEAIALWEEILTHPTNEPYRRFAVARLATTYLQLGDLQRLLGKQPQAEATLRKAIEYGEKAVGQEPDRPLPKHRLEMARRQLDVLRERAHWQEVDRLCAAQRFADVINLFSQSIRDQEERVGSGKDRDAAVRLLALRLDRFAWFLAHCTDERARDTKAAVNHASRATTLQPDVADHWYTLAMVQYRHGAWRDSLASLETLKAKEGEFEGFGWLLIAMNRQHLKQREGAQDALRKAVACIQEQERKAEGNAILRSQYEMVRPGFEALRREAENLIGGNDPAGEKIR